MKIMGWIIAIPLIVLALYAVLRFTFCRPNYFTVKSLTPMVEKIADDIIEHGVPESLEKIPDLPYELGCDRKIKYEKRVGLKDITVALKKDADWSVIEESCIFFYQKKINRVQFWFFEDYKYPESTHGDIDIRLGKTSIGTSFKFKDGKLVSDGIGTGFDNRFGFCRQFKQ
jgi:hypothetical protein